MTDEIETYVDDLTEWGTPVYSRDTLPPGRWGEYMKTTVTRAVRMDGEFEVWTREGVMSCDDGWLALDSKGNPYPIAADEFDRIYRPVGEVYIGSAGDTRTARVDQPASCPPPESS